MRYFLTLFSLITFLTFSEFSSAETIQILFTEDDSYSIEVAHIAVGDTIKWLPKNEGHNVEFIAGPEMHSLPAKSEINEVHTVIFKVPGVYLYGCTPHMNMGMLGLIIVGNDFHNLEKIKQIPLSRVATSVRDRLIGIAIKQKQQLTSGRHPLKTKSPQNFFKMADTTPSEAQAATLRHQLVAKPIIFPPTAGSCAFHVADGSHEKVNSVNNPTPRKMYQIKVKTILK